MLQSAGTDFGSCISCVLAFRLSSCGARASLPRGTWALPGPGIESNPCLLRWQADPLPLSRQGSPSPCLHRVFLLCASTSLSLLRRTLVELNQGPPSSLHFNLITPFQIQSPEVPGARTSTEGFGRQHSSACGSSGRGANFSSPGSERFSSGSQPNPWPLPETVANGISSFRFLLLREILQPRGYEQKKVCPRGTVH